MFKRLFVLLCCILLTSCSGQQEGPASGISSAEGSGGEMAAAGTMASVSAMPPEKAAFFLTIDREQIYEVSKDKYWENDYEGLPVAIQFYQGEPIVLLVKTYHMGELTLIDGEYRVTKEPALFPDSGLYLQRMDGSTKLLIPGEPLIESICSQEDREEKTSRVIDLHTWYLDGDGNCYYSTYVWSKYYEEIWGRDRPDEEKGYFLKLDRSGKVLYKTSLEPGFEAEGFGTFGDTMYVILGGERDGTTVKRVVAFDPETGVLSESDAFVLEEGKTNKIARGVNCFGWGPEGLYLYDSGGIRKVNLSDGSVSDFISFGGTAWTSLGIYWKLKDFRVLEDGSVQALYGCDEDKDTIYGQLQRGLLEELKAVEGERETITLRAASVPAWMKLRAAEFNKTNTQYWVVLEEFSTSSAGNLADYAKRTNVELSAGKGPDILCGDLLEEYLRGLIDKGMFLDLSGSLEAMGITEGDFLPAAFGSWREGDKIYGINTYIRPYGHKIRRDALPAGTGELDIRQLLDALSDREEDAFFYEYVNAGGVLQILLKGSEDLWGMVDWERGTCDFDNDLFAQILEVSKRYGYDGMHRRQHLVRYMDYRDIYRFDSSKELEAEGMTVAGVLFDDGCHGAVDDGNTLAVNAASPHREGALKFLAYLLDEKSQVQLESNVPVNRAALEKWIENGLEELGETGTHSHGGSYVDEGEIVKFMKTFRRADITEERIEEYLAALENVYVLPYRTGPILDIVYMEAADYFNGSKSIQEVTAVIHNRVQLYLDERK